MKAYADTGFLVSVHTSDANTVAARQRMRICGGPMPWTWLHEVEFRNAIRLQAFRGQIAPEEVAGILLKLSLGLENGVYFQATAALDEVTALMELLGSLHTAVLGTRTLDIMHVAQASVLGAEEFLTFDKRQASMAKAAGLRVPSL